MHSMKDWLFRTLFPEKALALTYVTNRLDEIKAEFDRKFSSWVRSPLNESQWVAKFVTLDADYKALEKEVAELRTDNFHLKLIVQKIVG